MVFFWFAFEGAETVAGRGCMMGAIAVALRGDRGLERIGVRSPATLFLDCGRSSGRSRIGTNELIIAATLVSAIAVALRGDRGLEQEANHDMRRSRGDCGRSSGRSRIGTCQ